MIFYVTFNDAPSGIYSSQVIDVVKFQQKELGKKIKLIAFISLRSFAANKLKIKTELPQAIVLPMLPGVHRWRINLITLKALCLVWKPEIIIGRSVLATNLALKCKNAARKIVYDGRGAIAAEWHEYGVITQPQMLAEISDLERTAVNSTDRRIAVSKALLSYWQSEYEYNNESAYQIIPCTLNHVFTNLILSEKEISANRIKLGFEKQDVVFIYSGSVAGWQSFDLLVNFISPVLNASPDNKLVILSDRDPAVLKLEALFPGKITSKKVSPLQVPNYLLAADFGLLIREQSVTNQVASPVKFAEYLACGLNVIISEHLGDYSDFVLKNKCGVVYAEDGSHPYLYTSVTLPEKIRNRKLALDYFSKENFKTAYADISRP